MAAGRKKGPEKKDAGTITEKRSMRAAAEKKLTETPVLSPGLEGQTPEQLIHELKVRQVELETQAEELRRIQRELEKLRYQYIDLYEFAPVGYISLNDKGIVTKANLTAATLLGVERSKLIRQGFSVFILPDHQATWYQYFRSLCRKEEKKGVTLTIQQGGTTTFPARLEGSCLTSDDASIVIHLTLSDISDIVSSQEALRTSHFRLESAMEAGSLAWWEMDCRTGVVSFSERNAVMLGYPAEQFTHYTDFTSLILPDDHEPVMQAMRDHLSGIKKKYEADYRIRTRTGEYRWFHDIGGISAYDQSGVPLRVTGLVMDITGRKQAEEALVESEQRYRGLIDGVPDYVLVHRNGKVLFVNPAAIEVMGYKDKDLVGSDILDYIAPESRDLVVAMVAKRAAGEFIPPYEVTIITKEGDRKVTEVHGSLVMYEGEPASLNVLSDITGRKQAEEIQGHLLHDLTQKNAELERFTYTVSHDLKSPLITIKGFLGYLEKDALAGDAKRLHEDVVRIHAATSKMEEFIAALLDLSRVGRIVNPPVRVSLAFLVQDAVEALDAQVRDRGVTLVIPGDLPEVYGDRVRLQQVMTNLIGNAIKFMGDQEEPRVEISADHKEGEEIICVRDNGIGIAPGNIDKIFSVFTRLNPVIPGAGIGLVLVKRIVEVHGGKCRVESAGLGKGCSFCFSLPDMPPVNDRKIHE